MKTPWDEVPAAPDPDKIPEGLPLERELAARTPEQEQEAEVQARVREEVEEMRHRVNPQYRAKTRAQALMDLKLDRAHSPANRLKIDYPKGGRDGNYVEIDGKRMGLRWCHDTIRGKFGPEDWEPMKDVELAKKLCPSASLREEADGKIYTGDSWLAMKPADDLEQRNASIYRKSRTMQEAVSKGEAVGGESMADLHRKTRTKSDPVGVRYSSSLEDDSP
jgi:hypothetical protein